MLCIMGKGGKGKGKAADTASKFQVELGGEYKDYEPTEDSILKRAFLVGQPQCRFELRGQKYEYKFDRTPMLQINLDSKKERKIRPPFKMTPPKDPLLPPGPMVVVVVPPGGVPSIDIDDPNNPGKQITVALPPGAPAGAKIAVPIPAKGEDISAVVKKQQGWSTGGKVAAGAAAVGALAVGGVMLGEHLSGGAISGWAEPGLTAAGDFATGAAEAAGDWAGDAGASIGAFAGDAADGAGEVAGDAGDWAAGAADDIGDWLGDATDVAGDFITDLF